MNHPNKMAPAMTAVSIPPLKNLLRVMMFSLQHAEPLASAGEHSQVRTAQLAINSKWLI
jgi:hypothetical protein